MSTTELELSHTDLGPAAARAQEFLRASRAENTRRAYGSDWSHFAAWCEAHDLEALPATPETVVLYLAGLSRDHKPSTLQRRVSSISQAHQVHDLDSPTHSLKVRALMSGIRRTLGTASQAKAPVMADDLKRMVAACPPDTLIGLRDRALLLVGFSSAFRRSELVALDVADLRFEPHGLVVTLRRSKTDQDGQGRRVGIPHGTRDETCPILALNRWLETAEITEGPVFRSVNRHGQVSPARLSDKAVALAVKKAAQAAGLDPAQYAGHSLRAGLATSAAAAGASERSIMAQTGHKSVAVARGYIRHGSLFRENAAAGLL